MLLYIYDGHRSAMAQSVTAKATVVGLINTSELIILRFRFLVLLTRKFCHSTGNN